MLYTKTTFLSDLITLGWAYFMGLSSGKFIANTEGLALSQSHPIWVKIVSQAFRTG